MARVNSKNTKGVSRVKTVGTSTNPHGVKSFVRDARSELFFASVTSFNEDSFYESADERASRIKSLITRDGIYEDTDFLIGLVSWLRNEAGLRTIPSVIASEAVAYRLAQGISGGNREIIASAVGRLDETAEVLAYWMSRYGRKIPSSVKRGVSDALNRKLSEYSYLKWQGRMARGQVSLSDVINLTHPKPKNDYMNNLFAEVLDARYNVSDAESRGLNMIVARKNFLALTKSQKIEILSKKRKGKALIKEAGLTHEVIAGEIGEITEAIWLNLLPTMGYNALAMNLRRMESSLSSSSLKDVAQYLKNEEAIRKSKIMPLAIMMAYRNVSKSVLRNALNYALEVSLSNVPEFTGRTLVLVDTSGSMGSFMSSKSNATRYDIATIFGSAIALRSQEADLVSFSHSNMRIEFSKEDSLMKVASKIHNFQGGTSTGKAISDNFNPKLHDRIVIVTDEVENYSYWGGISVEEALRNVKVPVYTWNLDGYEDSHYDMKTNRFTFAGLNDKAFSTLNTIENGVAEKFPWE